MKTTRHEIILDVIYPHTREHVWHALTDSVALAAWLMPNNFVAAVGHQFTFRAPPQPGFDGIVHCTVLVLEPPHLLQYTWLGGPMRSATTVTWSLESTQAGTHVRLMHTGFQGMGGQIARLILSRGWRGLLEKDLRRIVNELVVHNT
jgi:uncharacterized protein YndB with AHSA1/START domain